MSIEKLRELSKYGVLSDPDPYDLPLQAFTAGVNVRFRNGHISGGPVFRNVLHLGTTDPRYTFAFSPTAGANYLFLGYKNGTVTRFVSNAETSYSVTGYVPSVADATWTSTSLANVVYVNRSDRAPWYLRPSDAHFQNLSYTLLTATAATATTSNTLTFASVPAGIVAGLVVYDQNSGLSVGTVQSTTATTVVLTANAANPVAINDVIQFSGGSASPVGWDTSWTCSLLRTCSGALVALNVNKGATSYPTMVKTSSNPTSGNIPVSWDQTNAATNATESILSKMDGPIMDACSMGQDLVIYGLREAWYMHADGSQFIYSYTKLPFRKGAINANCSFELGGRQYVFGLDDIWMHDGNSEKSLCDQRTRDFIFGSLNVAQASKCFVQYNPKLNEMYFAYVSGDPYVNFLNSVDGCNRQAVLNLTDMTWTFDDLPSVFSASNALVSNALTYATVTTTYTTMGGSYQDQEDGLKRSMAYVGSVNAGYNLFTSLYALDLYGQGSTVAYPVDANATAPRYVERIGFDLHELNKEIRGYITLSSLYPQARIGAGASNLMIAVGASDNINDLSPVYSSYQPYDGKTLYKLDYNVAGRWLAYKIQFADYRELTITGFDFDIFATGNY